MSHETRCPECGAELPTGSLQGLCPKCLLAAGLESRDDEGRSAGSGSEAPTTPHLGTFVPPEPATLAAHFPQLEIIELLGHGGMGAVYKARQPRLDRLVALKIIRPESADTPAFAERFNREAKTLARLSHPQIVAVYDFGEVNIPDAAAGGQPRAVYFFLMEYVDGANLRQLMRAGELTPQQALAIVPQICDALQFAHNEGVVHRDIKPENILLDKRGRVKIADFGLAKLAAHTPDEFTLTGTHQVMGTPRYMAPEQMEGSHVVDHRADIYSLGVVFYEMLTGEVPMGHFEPPSKKVEIDVRLDEVVLRALAREPERRYQWASEVKTDMESISNTTSPAQTSRLQRETAPKNGQIETTRQMVQFPAIGFMVIGGLSLALGILAALMMSTWAFRRDGSDGAQFLLALPAILIFTALPTAMIVGGVKMLRLTDYRWATGASVLAMSPIPAGPLWLLSLPLGIWSLVVLAKPEVKRAFASGAKPPEPTEPDAARHVQNPAWGLIITGIISWVTIPLAFWIPIVRDLDAAQRTVIQISFGIVPLVVGTMMTLAGFRMKRLEGYWLAMFAAVLPIIVLVFKLIGMSFETLAINPADLVGVPMGLWALVVLSRSDVQAAFRARSASVSSGPPGPANSLPAGNPGTISDKPRGALDLGGGIDNDADEEKREAELAEIAPAWMTWSAMGLFGLGWISVGLLWNFRWLGIGLAIAIMAAVTYAVARLTLTWDPRVRAELDRQSRWQRGFAIVCALALFIAAMLALLQFQVDLADFHYDMALKLPKDLFETPSEQDLKDAFRRARFKEVGDVKLFDNLFPAGGHSFGSIVPQFVWTALFGTLFLYSAVWALFYTRRYRQTWKHSAKPSLNITWSCLSMLFIIYVLHLVVVGYSSSGTDLRELRYAATSDEVEGALERWIADTRYFDVSDKRYRIATERRTVGRLRFLHLSPSSWFDRYRASWRHIVLVPRPRLYLTLVAQDDPAEAYLSVNLPSHATDSPEPIWWQELVDDLDRSIRAATDTSDDKTGNEKRAAAE